jgi:hypothetical protein
MFARSEDDKSDWFTKNVSSELYNCHNSIIRRSEVDAMNVEGRVLEGEQALISGL